jgi:hypothetical protein
MSLGDISRSAIGKYRDVEKEFAEESKEMEVCDSICDVEPAAEGEPLAMDDGALTNVEIRRASELEQAARSVTCLPERKLHPHSDGYKQDGDDGKDHLFGKAYTHVRKEKPAPGGVKYIPTRPLPKPVLDAKEVEVYFGFRETYTKHKVPDNVTQEEIERM